MNSTGFNSKGRSLPSKMKRQVVELRRELPSSYLEVTGAYQVGMGSVKIRVPGLWGSFVAETGMIGLHTDFTRIESISASNFDKLSEVLKKASAFETKSLEEGVSALLTVENTAAIEIKVPIGTTEEYDIKVAVRGDFYGKNMSRSGAGNFGAKRIWTIVQIVDTKKERGASTLELETQGMAKHLAQILHELNHVYNS